MNTNDLKPGEQYNGRKTFDHINEDGKYYPFIESAPSSYRLLPQKTVENCVSPLPATPQHDPCRLFKKGDKVQVISLNGRCCGKYGEYLRGAYCIVLEDEEGGLGVKMRHNADDYILDPAYLKLVTPVEEQEPYTLIDSPKTYNIVREKSMVMTIHKKSHPNAKAAADAECARLNAEWRKEQK